MEELIVVLGALVTLVLSIVGMNIYRWRTDVLTGPYISNRDHELKWTPELGPGIAEVKV